MGCAVDAVVLIKADISRVEQLSRQLAQVPGVMEVCFVTGQYDLVARVQANGHEQLSQIVGDQMRSLDGLMLTETMTALRVHTGERAEPPPLPEPVDATVTTVISSAVLDAMSLTPSLSTAS